MSGNIWIYILVSGLVSFVIRNLPLTFIRKPITNRFIRSFLYYVPYETLALMTFPAIIYASAHPIAGAAAFAAGVVLAWKGKSLLTVSGSCCIVVLIIELLLH